LSGSVDRTTADTELSPESGEQACVVTRQATESIERATFVRGIPARSRWIRSSDVGICRMSAIARGNPSGSARKFVIGGGDPSGIPRWSTIERTRP